MSSNSSSSGHKRKRAEKGKNTDHRRLFVPSASKVSHCAPAVSGGTPLFTSIIDSTIEGWQPEDSRDYALDPDGDLYDRLLEAEIPMDSSVVGNGGSTTENVVVEQEVSVAEAKRRSRLSVRCGYFSLI